MITAGTLDITRIKPKLITLALYRHIDDLQPGESFLLYHRHDPADLISQVTQTGVRITTEYLESGPDWWRARITKL